MTTAALANSANEETTGPPRTQQNGAQDQLKKTAMFAQGFASDAGRAIGNLLPTATLQNITTRKYTLPDKTVASQVLMYRQLLHTKCKPGLKLSRPFEATPAQNAVKHMPWWEEGIDTTRKMVISYDNLITRLWLNGAIEPYQKQPQTADLLGGSTTPQDVETFITEKGLPPIPHTYWVERLGFQQPDPVTDFRSGGVLSLAMMVYMVESQTKICQRFFSGDASVLPFGITCINVTDMISKFLMLAKSTDKMDALLSQKPFWKMFGDPNAILAVQELAMEMLCDVVVELGRERKVPSLNKQHNTSHQGNGDKVTVFDFSTILERTERRVRDDLLGAGPKTVEELRSIAGRLRIKYQNQIDRKIERALQQEQQQMNGKPAGPAQPMKDVMDKATNMAGGLFAKIKTPVFSNFNKPAQPQPSTSVPAATEPPATIVDLPPPAPKSNNSSTDGDWAGTDIAPATDAISNFSIGDEDDDDIL